MDNSQNNQNTPTPQVQNQTQQGPIVQQPISGPHKEMGPTIEAPLAEYVAPSSPTELEPVLAPEVKEAGVESTPTKEVPHITEEHKKMGVTPPSETIPVSITQSSSSVTLPTYTQVQQTIKDTPVEESARWLAVLHKFILERLGVKA